MFTFTATFDKKNKYQYLSTHTGAQVVPKDTNRKRIMNGWIFNYKDWKGEKKCKIHMQDWVWIWVIFSQHCKWVALMSIY